MCTDVVIRAYRKLGVDLQVKVHEDMSRAFNSYPRLWRPDPRVMGILYLWVFVGASESVRRRAGELGSGSDIHGPYWRGSLFACLEARDPRSD